MNVLLELLIAATIITGLIIIRLIADRRAMQARLRSGQSGAECKQTACFGGCDQNETTGNPVSGRDELNRSA